MYKEFTKNLRAMGTDCSVALVTDSEELASQAHAIATQKIHLGDRTFSRFSPESELTQINTKKHSHVSDIFLEVVLRAKELFQRTNGIFNPLLQIERFGYDRDFEKIDPAHAVQSNEPYDIDFSRTVINNEQKFIQLQEGQRLDFGGFLKGYLAQKIADEIQALSPRVRGVIVNLGGDLCTRGVDENGKAFLFRIHNPVLDNETEALPLTDTCLATSGTYKRVWSNQGMSVHHILDATGTKNPVSSIISASILHPDGASAEAYAKVLLACGPNTFIQMLGDNIPFVAIQAEGTIIKHGL